MSTKVTSNNIELVDVSSSQELTNKTIDASLNDITNLPPSPAEWGSISGDIEDQSDLNAILVTQDEAIDDITNKINPYITNPNALFDVSPWIVYQNTAQSTPVDGTGGTPTGSLTLTRDTTSKVIGTTSFLLEQAAFNSQGQGASCDFTIDNALKNSPLQITLKYNAVGPMVFGENSDVRVFIYDIDNAQLITPAYNTLDGSGVYKCTFQSSDSANYRLIFHVATTNASGWQMFFGDVRIEENQGTWFPAISDWQSYTPDPLVNQGFGTIDNINLEFKRDGSDLIIRGYFRTGTVTGSEGRIALPNNLVIDSSVAIQTSAGPWFRDSVYTSHGGNVIISGGLNYVRFSTDGVFSNANTNPSVAAGGSSVASSTSYIHFSMNRIPIQGWTSGNKTIGDIDVNVPENVFVHKNATQSINNTEAKLTFQTTVTDTRLSWDSTNSRFIARSSGYFKFNGGMGIMSLSGNTNAYLYFRKNNATNYGITNLQLASGATHSISTATPILWLNAGEYVELWGSVNTNITVRSDSGNTFFSGEKQSGGDIFRTFNRSTTKYLASSLSSTTNDIASLAFSNLVVGRRYSVIAQAYLNIGAANASATINVIHDSSIVASTQLYLDNGPATFQGRIKANGYGEFIATATTMTVNYVAVGSNTVFGDGTKNTTFVTLTELNDTIEGNF